MKVFLLLTGILLIGCSKVEQGNSQPTTPPAQTASLTLAITGMHCDACAETVAKTLTEEQGVVAATCSFAGKQADVTYDPSQIQPQALLDRVEKLGYTVQLSAPGESAVESPSAEVADETAVTPAATTE